MLRPRKQTQNKYPTCNMYKIKLLNFGHVCDGQNRQHLKTILNKYLRFIKTANPQ